MKTTLLAWVAVSAVAGAATVDDLWITEVVPSTGQVEVTNVSDEEFTTSSALPFCHRFRYGDRIPSGTTFGPGESKVFSLDLSNAADSDLWLYRGGSFGSAANIITGLKWGPAAGVGRTGIATTAGKWDGVGLPAPAEGMALRLAAPDPTSAARWVVAEPDLGQHSFPFEGVDLELSGNEIRLSWEGGSGPFRIEGSANLDDWDSLTGLLAERSHVLERDAVAPMRFFRVRGNAVVEE